MKMLLFKLVFAFDSGIVTFCASDIYFVPRNVLKKNSYNIKNEKISEHYIVLQSIIEHYKLNKASEHRISFI